MQTQRRYDQAAVPDRSGTDAGAGRQESVALSRNESHVILGLWASAELAEIREHWYPAEACGFSDYKSGHRQLVDGSEIDWHVERAGWVIGLIAGQHRGTLKRLYLSGDKVLPLDRREALDAFGREWAAWAGVDDPVNSL